MVFNETTNYDFNVPSKQGRTQMIFAGKQNDCNLMLYLTTKHVFGNFWGAICSVVLHLVAISQCRHNGGIVLWEYSSIQSTNPPN